MTESLILTRRHWQAMRRHVSRVVPLEACGLLAGKNGRVVFTLGIFNTDRSAVRYRMEPRAQWRAFQRMEAAGLELALEDQAAQWIHHGMLDEAFEGTSSIVGIEALGGQPVQGSFRDFQFQPLLLQLDL